MATSKRHHITKPNYRFLPMGREYSLSDPTFEFDESDLFNTNSSRPNNSPEFLTTSSRFSKHSKPSSSPSSAASDFSGGRPASVPVNVPDWSKILGNEYRESRRKDKFDEDDADDDDDDDVRGDGERKSVVPPHEFLARTRMASLSVHEGVGRTLKGRDLSRVRNAIWAKTGFQD